MSERASSPLISDEDIRETLQDVMADVLEQFAFMFINPVEPADLTIPNGHILRAEIRFSGPFSGWLSLCGTQSFCLLLAANVLGMDAEELTPEHATDALKELVNVTCGELLVALSGKQTVFDLSVPSIEKITPATFKIAMNRTDSICVMIDDDPLIISAGLTAP